jgi:hypothetical protein
MFTVRTFVGFSVWQDAIASSDNSSVGWLIGSIAAVGSIAVAVFLLKTWRSTERGVELDQRHFLGFKETRFMIH